MDTSVSFLESLQVAPDKELWSRLVEIYTPLIRGWLRRQGAASDDIDDVVQEVLTVVVRRFPEFQREPRKGAFRSWLRTIAANCLRDHWRRNNRQAAAVGGSDFAGLIHQLADSDSGVSKIWDREHDAHVTKYLLKEIQGEFSEKTWQAFQRFAMDGLSAEQVGKELDMSSNAVFIAKSRVLSRLRHRGRGMID